MIIAKRTDTILGIFNLSSIKNIIIMKTHVIFLHNVRNNDTFAFFVGKNEAYSHIGQHSPCSPEYAGESIVLSSTEDYQELHNELISIGYTDLLVYNTLLVKFYHRTSKGYVFSHYYGHEIGMNRKGYLKQRIKRNGVIYSLY